MPSQPSSAICAQFSGSQPLVGRGDLAPVLEGVLVAHEALGRVLQLLLFVGQGQIHFFFLRDRHPERSRGALRAQSNEIPGFARDDEML